MALVVDSVRKSYGDRRVLQDVYIHCEIGQVVGLLGRNGCGKSTLMKVITRNASSEYSYIKAGDKVLLNKRQTAKHIAYLPQESFLPQNEKVKTILRLCLDEISYKIQLNIPEIKSMQDSKIQHLSGGEKRYVELISILHHPAKHLLLDETFNGLSPILRVKVSDEIQRIKTQKAILITDHDFRSIIRISDKVYFLGNGKTYQVNHLKDLVRLGYLPQNYI